MPRRYIDLSHPLSAATPPWPGNPGVDVDLLDQIPRHLGPGDRQSNVDRGLCNVSAFRTCTHTGTHMDAPTHFYNGVASIDRVPLEQCIGPTTLIHLAEMPPRVEIQIADLIPWESSIRRTRKILFNTGWARRWNTPEYFFDYPAISESAALWLIERRIELVGVDTPSVDREPYPVHYALLGANVVIVENLRNLDELRSTEFDLIVTPLPLADLEASPVRAVAMIEE